MPRRIITVLGTAAALTATMRPPVTLNAASQRNAELARQAATKQANDKGLLWLEHINIVVGDREEAERFYFEEGLGCFRDPAKPGGPGTSGTMWANLGNQQFHLAQEEDDDPRQVVRGSIGLCLPDAEKAASRLEKFCAVERHDATRFTVTCPVGNTFHCYQVAKDPPTEGIGKRPKMVNLHKGDGYAGDAFSVRNGPGIRYVQFLVEDAQKAAQSYVNEFGGGVTEKDDVTCVAAGLGPVHLIFESAEPDPDADARQDGVHLCVYVDAFSERYERLSSTARMFTNPRFNHLDTCDSLDEALASRTFRFAFPAVPFVEHETRALSHAQFLKRVKYEPL